MKKQYLIILTLLAAIGLTGCVSSRPTTSVIDGGIKITDANTLAVDTVGYLSDVLPPAKTTLVVDLPRGDDGISKVFTEKLRARGYGVTQMNADRGAIAPQGAMLRYIVTPFENGVLLRLQYPGAEAARFYLRTTAGLQATAPFTVRSGVGQ